MAKAMTGRRDREMNEGEDEERGERTKKERASYGN